MIATGEAASLDIFTQIGAVGVALVVGYLMLRRSDTREKEKAQENRQERERLLAELTAEREAHSHTKLQLEICRQQQS